MSVPQYLALSAIALNGGSATDLAHQTGVSGPAVSQLLAGLTAAGLIQREPMLDDRRRHSLALSVAGTRAYQTAQRRLHEQVASLLTDLPRPEADGLTRALPHIEALLTGTPLPRRPPHPPKPKRARHHPIAP